MLHGLRELPFSSAYFFFKVTTILCAIQTAKKGQTEKFFFEKSVNELIRLGVDIFASLKIFKRSAKEFLLEKTVSSFDQLNSYSWFLNCACSNVDLDLIDICVFTFALIYYLRKLILSSSSYSSSSKKSFD